MNANSVTDIDCLFDDLAVKAITEAASECGENEIDDEAFKKCAQRRFEELTEPLKVGIEDFFVSTIHATVVEVAARHIETDRADPFSIDRVVDKSMKEFQRIFGKPQKRVQAREAIREYLEKAYRLE